LRENRGAMRKLVAEIFDPGTRYEYEMPLPSDIVRALELDARFKKLNLGLVDGTVLAIAERRRVYRVLTTDRRDFGSVRVGPRLTRALELRPRESKRSRRGGWREDLWGEKGRPRGERCDTTGGGLPRGRLAAGPGIQWVCYQRGSGAGRGISNQEVRSWRSSQ